MGNSHTKNQNKGRYKKQVHWKAPEHPGPPGKPELVANVDATPDVVTIKWEKPKSDGGSAISGYLVEHRRTGSPHWVRATPLLIIVPELTLSGLEPGWRYQFRVSAKNSVGMSEPGEVSEPLTVTLQRSIITAPKFTEELKDSSALENDMAEFIVHVIGQPPPKVCWFKDGFEIFSSRRTRIITENGKSVLTFHQVSLSDEGEIKCTATNRAGHASTKSTVKVEAPPKIRLPRQYEEGLLFELDELIRLKVSIAGRPQPLVFWSHNGESIQNDERFEIIDTDKSSSLRVGEARRSDRGEYQIRAVNKIGEDSTSFLVTVTDRPKPPENVKVVMALGKSVTLSWSEPEDDGGCKIGAYIVEYYRVGWNVWLKALTCRYLTTMLNDLIEGSEYKFRVKAESPYGVSDPSDETNVIFIPDPKRGLMSAPARSRSQPRDVIKDDLPVPPKRRSASSTRNASRENNSHIIIPDTVPSRPKREKIKSPPKTPELSPKVSRKEIGINTNMFDRASLAREIAYGIDMKIKKPENKLENKLEVKNDKPPSPNIRNKSPSRFNAILSSILPGKKSPSPGKKSPSPKDKENKVQLIPNSVNDKEKPENINIPTTIQMLEVRSERSDLYDRSPSPMERRLSLKANGDKNREKSKSPSPQFLKDRSPSPSKLSTRSNDGSRRGSVRSNRINSLDNEEQGSSEFMLVLFPEHGDKYYQGQEENELVFMDLDDDMIPPPMSLSAPELGAEPPVFEPLRTSVSSSELLYERSLTRFRKAAEAEEAELVKRATERKASSVSYGEEKIKLLDEDSERRLSIPKILINSKDQEDLIQLEKKHSFSRRLSAGGTSITQQYMWAKRRQSLRNHTENTDIAEHDKRKTLERSKDFHNQSLENENKYIEELLPDANLSDKRKEMLYRQRSQSEEKEEEEFARVRARMEEEKKPIKNGAKDVNIIKEDKWEEESDSEEISDDDDRFKFDTMPPLVQPEEEETYHPRMMVMTNMTKNDEPFEILSKPSPLPDPNFVPKPILKKPEDNKKPIPDKPVRKNLVDEPSESLSPSSLDVSPARSRSRTPSPSPGRTVHRLTPIRTTAVESQIQQQAADAARNKRHIVRNNSEEETTVVIDYYGAIVQQYGTIKKGQNDETKEVPKVEESKGKLNLSALDVLAKYAKNNSDEEEEDEDEKTVKNILAKYNQDLSNQIESPKVVKPKQSISRRQPSPSPLMRKTLGPQEPLVLKRQASPSLPRRQLETNSQEQIISKRQPSPSVTRRPMNIATTDKKRKTSRTRSSSKTRQQSASTPSDLKTTLEKITKPPSPRPMTPEQEAMKLEAEIKLRSSIDYLTDLAMFIVACWLYFFKNPLLAIPVLLITVYRQLKKEFGKYIPAWMTQSKNQ